MTPGSNQAEITFKDPYFEDVIRELLGKSLGSIYVSDVSQIKSLTARVKGIRSIEDLRHFTALEELDLYGNKICDLTPLSALTTLKTLNISENYAALQDKNGGKGMNLSPLSSLVLLERLDAEKNSISDISAVSGLVNLQYLNLRGNAISSVEPLSKLGRLKELQLGMNRIEDASPLSGCTGLNILGLESNGRYVPDENNEYSYRGISDMSFVAGLRQLTQLNVSYNIISSLVPVSNLKSLEILDATGNYISDIECLRGLQIKYLYVAANLISDFSPIEDLPMLRGIGYQGNPIEKAGALEAFLFRQENPGATLPPELAGDKASVSAPAENNPYETEKNEDSESGGIPTLN